MAAEGARLEVALERLRRDSVVADERLAAAVDEARAAEDQALASYQAALARRTEAERLRTDAKGTAARRERKMQLDSEAVQVGRVDRFNDDLAAAWHQHQRQQREAIAASTDSEAAV